MSAITTTNSGVQSYTGSRGNTLSYETGTATGPKGGEAVGGAVQLSMANGNDYSAAGAVGISANGNVGYAGAAAGPNHAGAAAGEANTRAAATWARYS